MKAVILAGGEGTRLRPVTDKKAKPFVLIDNKPCIEHVIEALVRDGFNDILVTMYYRPGDIIRHLGSGNAWDANIAYSIERTPLGTFGGVKKNEGFLNETFVVASGDVLADVNFLEIYDYHKKNKAIATIALTTVDNPTEYGIVGLREDGRIERFCEKPAPEEVFSNLINAGIYVIEPEVFELFPLNKKMDFSRTLFPALLKANLPLFGKELSGLWIDIGRPSDLIQSHLSVFSRRLETDIHVSSDELEGAELHGKCYIGENVRTGTGVQIEDAYVYDDCLFGNGVKIVNSVLSRETLVDNNAIIKNSFICDSCRIGKGVHIDDSVLGENITVSDGKTIRGQKLDSDQHVK